MSKRQDEQLVKTAVEQYQLMHEALAYLAFQGRHYTEDELRNTFRNYLILREENERRRRGV